MNVELVRSLANQKAQDLEASAARWRQVRALRQREEQLVSLALLNGALVFAELESAER